MPRPLGSPNAPRARAIKTLEERFPQLANGGLLYKMAEQAVLAEAMLNDRANLEVPEGEQHPDPVTIPDRNTVQSMYERVTQYVLPRLKSTEMKLGGIDGGTIRVSFERDDGPA